METGREVQSRGIVFLAGGVTYFLNAYLNCAMLRKMGCTLPIEWFHLSELTQEQEKYILDTIPTITIKNLPSENTGINTKELGGWQNKVNSVINSSFDEVLFLDADSFPVRDPSYIFDDEFFRSTDCVLFPDPFVWKDEDLERLRKIFDVPNLPQRQVESGQMMFKPKKCMAGLLKAKELNDNYKDTYKIIYGDKDTFIIGMEQAKQNYKVSPFLSDGIFPVGMFHKDLQGEKLFVHLAGGKWQRHGRPYVREETYPYVKECLLIISNLKTLGLI